MSNHSRAKACTNLLARRAAITHQAARVTRQIYAAEVELLFLRQGIAQRRARWSREGAVKA